MSPQVDAIVSLSGSCTGFGGHLRLGGHAITSPPGSRLDRMELRDTFLVLASRPMLLLVLRSHFGAGPLARHVVQTGLGALHIDRCRSGIDPSVPGRWPPNLVLVHTPGCRPLGFRSVPAPVINRFVDGMKPFGNGAGHRYESVGGGVERVPVWQCTEPCPVHLVDRTSGGVGSRFFPCFADLDSLSQWLVRLVTPQGGQYLLNPITHEPIEAQVRTLHE